LSALLRLVWFKTQPLTQHHFWHAQLPAYCSHWLAGTLLKHIMHSFSVVIRHTKSTRTPAFTQTSSFHKLSIPPGYFILMWCIFFKPCTKLMLHCNHKSGHLKTEHTESLLLLLRHLGNLYHGPAVSMISELLVAHEKLWPRCWQCMLCPCGVRNRFFINFLNRTILLCMPCAISCQTLTLRKILWKYQHAVQYFKVCWRIVSNKRTK
jgi:hypothetical protein